ncbi:DNA-directed RNA polymerase I subunit RPA34 isoform X2 [Hemitrygon akajei]|uniref:DNA-directed RNA polymerase I subunit RPA34 isoform X2 n=1 Tax=Hemitrygon akajei TaxID=2704970 RepID=UPI003BF9849F
MRGFQSPPEFQACPHAAPRGIGDPSSELWLIKAPADFEPRSFSGKKVPLVGFQSLRSKICEDKVYNVFATMGGAGDVCLILPSEAGGKMESCSEFAGCLTIDENWEGAAGGSEPSSIPTSPAPSVPPGLKLRFQPFGVGPPGWSPRQRQPAPKRRKKRAREEPASGGLETSCQATDSETPGDSGKKKKRRKQQEVASWAPEVETDCKPRKRKRDRDESLQVVPNESEHKHKKKKKKKDKS